MKCFLYYSYYGHGISSHRKPEIWTVEEGQVSVGLDKCIVIINSKTLKLGVSFHSRFNMIWHGIKWNRIRNSFKGKQNNRL